MLNNSHGSRYVFLSILKIQIKNQIGFPPDDNNTSESCSAGDVTRSIIDHDIARLERSIRDMEDNIRALKSRRNESAPISRLPVEILCNIFSLSIHERPESWTNFSQVSRHWRSLSLSAAKLWTEIPIYYPRWAQEMLIRSKKAKLTIRCDFSIRSPRPKTIKTIRSCLYEMDRVEAIKITYGIPRSILEEIFRDLPKSAPQLHTLRIGCYSPGFSGIVFSISENFLYDTERLQCVELINCKIGWASPLLTGLTRLTLEVEDSSKANSESSINQFLHALQQMPALTDLCLKNSIPDNSENPSTYPVVNLPFLRVLNISSGVDALTAVLHHITFPHSAILDLTCKKKRSAHIDFSDFLSVLATKFLPSLVFRSLSLQTQSYALEFYLWTTATIHDCFPSTLTSQSQLRLVLAWPLSDFSKDMNFVKALTCAFDAISLSFLTQLQISTFDYIDSPTWVKTFEKLPLLEWVTVESYATYGFFEALLVYKTKTAEKLKTAYRNITLPKLRCICLKDTDFGSTAPRSISVDKLLGYLAERYERDAEVQVLRLDGCYGISSDEVARLKEIVVDVIWDGVGQEALKWIYHGHESEEDRDDDDGDSDDSDGNSF